ncbi:MAG: hypothetical protein JWP96_2624 [Polaromonas sp.]|nr:hypothetical protein [Polaromonas sp.]
MITWTDSNYNTTLKSSELLAGLTTELTQTLAAGAQAVSPADVLRHLHEIASMAESMKSVLEWSDGVSIPG